MIDKYLRVNKYFFENKQNINIKLFSDIHYSNSFDNKKLKLIENKIKETNTDYICIVGDIIDNTNLIYDNPEKIKVIFNWLENLGKKYKVFIALGNHDNAKLTKKGWVYNNRNTFWKKVNSLEGIYVSSFINKYEDDKIIIILNEPDYDYYKDGKENKDILLENIKFYKKNLTNLDDNKVKIFLNHSPIYMTDTNILKYLKEIDFIFSGHMHNGLVPIGIDKLINNNIGIISPNKKIFPDNSRGLKIIKDNKYLLVSSGITKISEHYSLLKYFNKLYPMDMDEIKIITKKEKFN